MTLRGRVLVAVLIGALALCVAGCRRVGPDQMRRDFVALRYVQEAQEVLSRRPMDRPRAVARLDRAMELAPDEHTVSQLAPGLYLEAGEYAKALALLEKEPGADPFMLGQCMVKTGRKEEGAELLVQTAEDANRAFRAGVVGSYVYAMRMNNAGYVLADAGVELNQAKSFLEIATDELPLDTNCVDSLGWLYYRMGRFREAVFLLERAVRQQTAAKQPDVYYHLGAAYARLGNDRRARKMLAAALRMDPTHAASQDELRRLQWALPHASLACADASIHDQAAGPCTAAIHGG